MFTVNRKALLSELALLQTVAEARTTLPVLAYVKFEFDGERLVLTTTNIDVSIVTEVQAEGEPWAGCLPSAQLYALLKLLTEETITLTLKDGPMQVRAGKSKHLLPVMPVDQFPQIERVEGDGISVAADTFNAMLSSVDFAMLLPSDHLGHNQQRFTGVHFSVADGRLSLTATNITRLATTLCMVETSAVMDAVIPRQAVSALLTMKEGNLSVDISKGFIHFASGLRHLYVRRLADDRFPDWRSMFPASYEHTAEINSADLSAAVKRAMLTQGEGRLIIVGLRWTWASDELLIETRGGDRGKSDEVVEIACPSLNGVSIALGMNGQQVLDALPLLGEKVICGFSDGTFIVELKPQQPSPINFTYYINTVTLKHWQ